MELTLSVGISGYNYASWRGKFYPRQLAVRRWLEYASRQFNSIELNGTFYSLKSPAVFRRWVDATPDDFTFAKGQPLHHAQPEAHACRHAPGQLLCERHSRAGPK